MRTTLRARVVVLLAALGLATACGAAPSTPARSGPVEITFWSWTKGTAEVVADYNALQSDVRVRFEQIPSGLTGGYAKISAAAKAGRTPDVFNVEYPTLPEFVSQGAVADLTGYADRFRDAFPEQVRGLTELGGRTWAVPLDASPMVFYYRADFFDAHHIAVPTSWDGYRAAAEKVRAADPRARIGTFFPDDPNCFAALAWQAGGRWFDSGGDGWRVAVDDAPSHAVARFWDGLIHDDLVRVQNSFSPEWIASVRAGETVGYLGATWGAGSALINNQPDQAGRWAVAPLPNWGEPATGMYGGSTFAVGRDSRQVDAAVRFITWMTTDPEAVAMRIGIAKSTLYPAASALVPVAASSFDHDFFGGQDVYGLFTAAAGRIRPGWTWGPAMSQTDAALTAAFGSLTSGHAITDALDQAQRATVDELRRRGIAVAR